MSTFLSAMSRCIGCDKVFSYNPMSVPSIPINGHYEPVCAACVEKANPIRIKNGLEPIVPAADAYSACADADMILGGLR